jgi:uncharacterized membrane protein YkoI
MNFAMIHRDLLLSLSIFIILGLCSHKSLNNTVGEFEKVDFISIYASASIAPKSVQSTYHFASSNSTFNAQGYPLNDASNMTNTFAIERNWTGSIPTFPAIMEAFKSQIKTSMNEATTIALDEVGINSTAISNALQPDRGFLVFVVRIVDSNNQIHEVVVDAGNGNVLADILLPKIDLSKVRSGPIPSQPLGPVGPIGGSRYSMPPLPPPIPNSGGGYSMPPLPPPIPNSGGGYSMPPLSIYPSPVPGGIPQPIQPQPPAQ